MPEILVFEKMASKELWKMSGLGSVALRESAGKARAPDSKVLVTPDRPVRAAADARGGPEGQLAGARVVMRLGEAEARG